MDMRENIGNFFFFGLRTARREGLVFRSSAPARVGPTPLARLTFRSALAGIRRSPQRPPALSCKLNFRLKAEFFLTF